jgi:hypothetical protein
MMLLPWRMVWSRLVNCLPRAAVLIHKLSWQILEGPNFGARRAHH